MLRALLCILVLCLFSRNILQAQTQYSEQVKKYITKYFPLAIAEQKRSGIPAAITLAQAIHETDAGRSDLMLRGNNHFGLKCKSDWKGDTIIHSDNVPDECFKKYASADESYKDHSNHLKKNQRYAPLFTLSVTDYAAWAIGLKTYGYATNNQYSIKIIKIIEDYHLQEYTYLALSAAESKNYPLFTDVEPVATTAQEPAYRENATNDSLIEVIDSLQIELARRPPKPRAVYQGMASGGSIADTASYAVIHNNPPPKQKQEGIQPEQSHNPDKEFDSGKTIVINGLKAFYAYKDEMLLKYAVKYKVRYARLLELNDLQDAPLPSDMPIYLEKKLTSGTHSKHTVKKGETMHLISQLEGVQLKKLYELNLMNPKEEPAAGALLELKEKAIAKPELIAANQKKKIVQQTNSDKENKKPNHDEYIPINHKKATETDSTKENLVEVTPQKPLKGNSKATVNDTDEEDSVADIPVVTPARPTPANNKARQTEARERESMAENAKKPTNPDKKKNEPNAAKQKKAAKTYQVRRGDTLTDIAEKFHVTVKQLKEWNHLKDSRINKGQELVVSK